MSISLSSLFGGTTVPSTTLAPNDQFGSALNQLAAQVQQFQSQVTAAGASAYNNATFISTFNQFCNAVGQYQTSVTNAGTGGAPYQPALNAIDAQLNQIKTTLTTPTTTTAATSPYGYNPYGNVYGTDTYSAGLSTLSQQIMQLQGQVASMGVAAGSNQTIISNFQTLATQVNSYINTINASGQAASNPMLVQQLNQMTAQLNQIQTTLQSDQQMAAQNPYGAYPGTAVPGATPGYPGTAAGYPGTMPGYPAYPMNPNTPLGQIGAMVGMVGQIGQQFGWFGRRHRDGDRWQQGGMPPGGWPPAMPQGAWQERWRR